MGWKPVVASAPRLLAFSAPISAIHQTPYQGAGFMFTELLNPPSPPQNGKHGSNSWRDDGRPAETPVSRPRPWYDSRRGG